MSRAFSLPRHVPRRVAYHTHRQVEKSASAPGLILLSIADGVIAVADGLRAAVLVIAAGIAATILVALNLRDQASAAQDEPGN